VAFVERKAQREEIHHPFTGTDQYRFMVEHFADCVLNSKPLRYTAHEAAANVAVIEALYRSARNGGIPEALAAK
jgi:predicted dehydrogenase